MFIGYNEWREWCGLPRAVSFDDLRDITEAAVRDKFRQVYRWALILQKHCTCVLVYVMSWNLYRSYFFKFQHRNMHAQYLDIYLNQVSSFIFPYCYLIIIYKSS